MKIQQLVLVLCAATSGCKHDAIEADPARTGASLEASTSNDALSLACPSGLAGPAMALISVADKKHYCIDKTEVTQSQYAKFVAAAGNDVSLIAGIPECFWQKSFEMPVRPDEDPSAYGCPKGEYDPAAKPDQPVGCTTWCMAYAYCRWAGKRLCGKIGGGPISEPSDNYKNLEQSQWYFACTQGGSSAYQYGDTYDPACSPPALEPVTSAKSQCTGQKPPYNEISGMNSGVSEWEDACLDQSCFVRGGGILDLHQGEQAMRCDVSASTLRGVTSPGTGFRCCLDVD